MEVDDYVHGFDNCVEDIIRRATPSKRGMRGLPCLFFLSRQDRIGQLFESLFDFAQGWRVVD
jgi:hypothetical protein